MAAKFTSDSVTGSSESDHQPGSSHGRNISRPTDTHIQSVGSSMGGVHAISTAQYSPSAGNSTGSRDRLRSSGLYSLTAGGPQDHSGLTELGRQPASLPKAGKIANSVVASSVPAQPKPLFGSLRTPTSQQLPRFAPGRSVLPILVTTDNFCLLFLYRQQSDNQQASIPLTGDSKADADILAFYKARQKLIQRGV